MRQYLSHLLLLGLFCVLLSGFILQSIEPRKLIAESNHSTILFSVPISNGLTRIVGTFNTFSINLDVIGNDFTQSKISAIIQVNSINTGIPERDADLKTKDFFESEKYPEITFVSDKIVKTPDGFLAMGQFQMHGITKSIELPFRITGQHNENVIGFTSRSSIKRSDFNLGTTFKHTTDDHFIGDDIGIEIDFWTKKPRLQK